MFVKKDVEGGKQIKDIIPNDIIGRVAVGLFIRKNDRPTPNDWTNCYIKNIPLDWNVQKLVDIFGQFGQITSAKIIEYNNDEANQRNLTAGTSKGFGFINFSNHLEAENAVANLNGSSTGNYINNQEKTLYVARAQKKVDRVRYLKQEYEVNKQNKIQHNEGTNIYVKNFNLQYTDDKLRTLFSQYGNITSCKIMRDYEGGPSKGFGFVCFQTPEEALNAMQLHNQIIDDRPIYVQRAQKREERRAQLETQFARNQYKQMIPPQIPYMSTFPYFQGMPMGRQGPYPIIPQIFGRNVLPNRNPMGQYGRNVQYPIPAYTTFNNPNIPSSNQNNSQQNPQNQPYPKKIINKILKNQIFQMFQIFHPIKIIIIITTVIEDLQILNRSQMFRKFEILNNKLNSLLLLN